MLTAGARRSRPAGAWMDRLGPSVVPAVVIALVALAAGALEARSPLQAVAAGGTGLALVGGLLLLRRGVRADGSWLGSRAVVMTPADQRPQGRGPRDDVPAQWRVVAALGRVEARELVSSPWFGTGVGFQLWLFLAFGVIYNEEDLSLWAEVIQQLVVFSHPLVGMLVVAAHAATTRARHDQTDELYESCPAGSTVRTRALLSTAWVGAASVAAFLGLFLLVSIFHSQQIHGPVGDDALPDVLSGLVMGGGGVVLGVALGRWVRWRLAPVVAVVAVGAIGLRLAATGEASNQLGELSTFLSVTPEVFLDRRAWWHLAWLVGLTVLVAGLGLAGTRHENRRNAGPAGSPAAVLAVVGTAVAVVAGAMATRPLPPASAQRMADRINRPAAHQVCAAAAGPVQVCEFRGYGELRARVAAEVAPVGAALPAGAAPITLRPVFTGDPRDLPPAVQRRLQSGPLLGPGEVALPLEAMEDRMRAARFLVSLAAVGLPVVPDPGPKPVVVAGQAGGVVALWLAARGLDGDAAARLATAQKRGQEKAIPASADAFDRGYVWPSSCDSAPVVWSSQDLAAARALLALPAERALAVVHTGWDRWLDPATPTDDLLLAAGLPPLGAPDDVVSRDPGGC